MYQTRRSEALDGATLDRTVHVWMWKGMSESVSEMQKLQERGAFGGLRIVHIPGFFR